MNTYKGFLYSRCCPTILTDRLDIQGNTVTHALFREGDCIVLKYYVLNAMLGSLFSACGWHMSQIDSSALYDSTLL